MTQPCVHFQGPKWKNLQHCRHCRQVYNTWSYKILVASPKSPFLKSNHHNRKERQGQTVTVPPGKGHVTQTNRTQPLVSGQSSSQAQNGTLGTKPNPSISVTRKTLAISLILPCFTCEQAEAPGGNLSSFTLEPRSLFLRPEFYCPSILEAIKIPYF